MLIAKKNSTNAFCVLTTTKYGMKEKTKEKQQPQKLSSSLKSKSKKESKKHRRLQKMCTIIYQQTNKK